MSESPLFTTKEFTEYARISMSTLYMLWAQGRGPDRTRVGKRIFIAKDTAAEWLKEQEQAA